MHRIIFTTVAMILYVSALYAQFPAGPSTKTELGRETSQNQYLIYQGSGTPSYTPSGINNAYTYVDTLTNTIYLYSRSQSTWRSLADSLSINNRVDSVLIDVIDIRFDTSYNNTDFAAGEMGWDETDGFRFGVLDNYSFMVGQDVYKQVHNTSADTIYQGQAVMFTGADGASTVFRVARMVYPANPPELLIGIAAIDILPGEFGVAVQNGYVKGINVDAQGWLVGDKLYLSETTPGQLTTTPGGVLVAAVMKTGTNGTIYTRPDFYAGLSKAEADAVGAMVTGNTETLIDVTYQADSTIDFVVNDDLSLYDNSVSGFLTTEVDGSITNEIQDLSLSGNTLSLTGDLTTVDLSSVSNWVIDGTNIYSDISNSLDSATYSFAAGSDAGSNRDVDSQIAIGRLAGQSNTGIYQNAFGYLAGRYNTGGYQKAFGYLAGENNTGDHQNAFGLFAGQNNTANDQNAFGRYAGQNNTGVYQNAFGYSAGNYNVARDQNAFGRSAGLNNTGVEQNAFGFQAGRLNTGDSQNAFGRDAGEVNTGVSQNAFGNTAGENNTGDYQNAFGYGAGQNNTGAYQNAFGFLAGENNTGTSQQAFGIFAGRYNQGDFNISIGRESGYSTVTTLLNPGDYNTWLNYRAGYAITEGNHNIGIGREAGDIITDGDNNIYIGGFASASSSGVNNETVIGYNLTGNGDNTVTIGNSSVVDTYLKGILNIDDVTQDNTETDVLVLQLDGEVQSRTVSSINAENTLQSVTDNGATTTNTILVGTSGGIRTEIQAGKIKQYLETAEGTEQQVSSGTVWRGIANKIRRSYGDLSAESAIPGSGAAIEYKEWSGYNSADAGYVIGINREVQSTGAFTSSGAAPMKMTYQFNNGTALQNLFELNSSQEVKMYGTPFMTNITQDNSESNILVLQSDGEVQKRTVSSIIDSVMESARNANATTSGTGTITVSHSLGVIPSVTITNASISPYVFSVSNVTTTSFTFKVFDMTGAAVTSTSVNFDYQLIIP